MTAQPMSVHHLLTDGMLAAGWQPADRARTTYIALGDTDEVLPPGEVGDEAIAECVRPGGSLTIEGPAPSQPTRYDFTHAGQMLRLFRGVDGWRVVAMVQVGSSTAGEIVEVTQRIAAMAGPRPTKLVMTERAWSAWSEMLAMAARIDRADRRRRRQARKQRRGWA